MKTWKGYNILDLFLITLGLLSVIISSILFKSGVVLVQSVLVILTVFTQAKGKIITQFLAVLTYVFYIYISYTEQLYGEAILYSLILLPISIYGIIHWLRNKNKQGGMLY